MTRAMQYRMFWLDLSVLLNSGLPLLRSLNTIIKQNSSRDKFCLGIKKIPKSIMSGCTFAEAMKISDLFSEIECNLVRAGEISGMLEVTIDRLANDRSGSYANQLECFYLTLGNMINAGVPILQALKLVNHGLDLCLQSAIERIGSSIREGGSIAEAMKKSGEFSPLEISLIDFAEQEGKIDSVFRQLGKMSGPIKFGYY